MPDIHGNLFLAVLGLALIEVFLWGTFNRFYFTIGIVILRHEVRASSAAVIPAAGELESRLGGSVLPSLVFRPLYSGQYAFRERVWSGFFRLGYTPVMHGLLVFDRTTSRVRVLGLANWFMLGFAGFIIYVAYSLGVPGIPIIVFLVVLLGAIYVIQARRFREVANVAAAYWSGDRSGRSRGSSGEEDGRGQTRD